MQTVLTAEVVRQCTRESRRSIPNNMKIGIDIDNTITSTKDSVEFFRILTRLLIAEHDIIIISNRDETDRENTEEYLDVLGIRYNKLIFTANKASYVLKNSVQYLFENSDEYFLTLPTEITVFKIREEGNFNFTSHKWIASRQTTELIDEQKYEK